MIWPRKAVLFVLRELLLLYSVTVLSSWDSQTDVAITTYAVISFSYLLEAYRINC